jgi:hypothetical protein
MANSKTPLLMDHIALSECDLSQVLAHGSCAEPDLREGLGWPTHVGGDNEGEPRTDWNRCCGNVDLRGRPQTVVSVIDCSKGVGHSDESNFGARGANLHLDRNTKGLKGAQRTFGPTIAHKHSSHWAARRPSVISVATKHRICA